MPCSLLVIDSDMNIKMTNYWNIQEIYNSSKIDKRNEEHIINELEVLLNKSFNLRMVSDVDVGIFLSGGIDSSLVASILQNNSKKKIETFTLGFDNKIYNESVVAKNIAKQIGTNHNEYFCSETDFLDTIPLLSDIYDEPFGDTSSIPTYLISKYSANKVKVILSGDGGDELFGGYSRYKFALNSKFLFNTPIALKNFIYKLSFFIKPSHLKSIERLIQINSYTQISDKYQKFQNVLLSTNLNDYIDKSSSFANTELINLLTKNQFNKNLNLLCKKEEDRLVTYLGVADLLNYLPNDILTKVDRASMFNGQEVREPFLDHDLVKFSLSIPDSLKINKSGGSKYLLKQVLKKYLDPELTNRPKQGFSIPIESWLKGKLKAEILEIANDNNFFELFNLNKDIYIKITHKFYNNNHDFNPHIIWFVFCLHNWYNRWIK